MNDKKNISSNLSTFSKIKFLDLLREWITFKGFLNGFLDKNRGCFIKFS
jgi:hypothetical protein